MRDNSNAFPEGPRRTEQVTGKACKEYSKCTIAYAIISFNALFLLPSETPCGRIPSPGAIADVLSGDRTLDEEESKRRFRERLKESRIARAMTQEQLGREADVPTMSVSHFETGHRFPNAETLRRLADALDVSADYLLGGVDISVGAKRESSNPEVASLLQMYEGMSKEARELVGEFVRGVEALDRKGRHDDG